MNSELLIQRLIEQTRYIINRAKEISLLDFHSLNWKENDGAWTILECVEHLNLYGEFYLPQIEKKIQETVTKNESEFKSGLIGNYFANSILPKEKLNKMKTSKDKNPLNSKLDKTTIEKFVRQQSQLLELLNTSRNLSLNRIKIATSISSLINLKLGDAFQFFINHMLRHFAQIDRILDSIYRQEIQSKNIPPH